MEMNKQEIVETLRKNLSGIADVALMPSIHQGIESDWSLSIMPNEGEQAHETLGRIFKIDIPDWKEKFNEATFGQGNEINRILTLHSSALLALLCFSHVSEENPFTSCFTCARHPPPQSRANLHFVQPADFVTLRSNQCLRTSVHCISLPE